MAILRTYFDISVQKSLLPQFLLSGKLLKIKQIESFRTSEGFTGRQATEEVVKVTLVGPYHQLQEPHGD